MGVSPGKGGMQEDIVAIVVKCKAGDRELTVVAAHVRRIVFVSAPVLDREVDAWFVKGVKIPHTALTATADRRTFIINGCWSYYLSPFSLWPLRKTYHWVLRGSVASREGVEHEEKIRLPLDAVVRIENANILSVVR